MGGHTHFPTLPPTDPHAVCTQCSRPAAEHWAVNFANGPFIGETVLLCPTAVFRAIPLREAPTKVCPVCHAPWPCAHAPKGL
jgi:hypothetical protein